jgi:single-strand DNA-binding protein
MNEPSITLIGNITHDPELRTTKGGISVCKLRIACNARVMDQNTNEWHDGEPLYMDVDAWGTLGENCASSLVRGERVIVAAVLMPRTFTTREGATRTVLEAKALDVGPSLKFEALKIEENLQDASSAPF